MLCRLGDSVAAAAYAAAALPDGPSQPVVRPSCKAAARRCLPVHGIGGGPIDVASSREAQALRLPAQWAGPDTDGDATADQIARLGRRAGTCSLRPSFWKKSGGRHLASGLADRTGTILGNGAMRVCGAGCCMVPLHDAVCRRGEAEA